MSKPGIIGTIQLAATLVFALPIALLGIEKLFAGDTTIGAAFVGIAVLMIVLEEYLTSPADIPSSVAQKTLGKVAKTPDDEE